MMILSYKSYNIEEHIKTKQWTKFKFSNFRIFSPGFKVTDPLLLFSVFIQ